METRFVKKKEMFEDFAELVKDLWPEYVCTSEQLETIYRGLFARADRSKMGAALRWARAEEFESLRPPWKKIRAWLAEHGKPHRNDFEILLGQVRHAAARGGWGDRAKNWTDEEAWLNFLGAQTVPITHNTITKRIKPDADGRLLRESARTRKMWQERWRQEPLDSGAPVPEWL